MQGRKTHEQQLRTIERKPDVPDARRMEDRLREANAGRRPTRHEPDDRRYPVSPQGGHREDRDHNKHNHPSQPPHGPQRHGPEEEKGRN